VSRRTEHSFWTRMDPADDTSPVLHVQATGPISEEGLDAIREVARAALAKTEAERPARPCD
jgi:hypothetical protein